MACPAVAPAAVAAAAARGRGRGWTGRGWAATTAMGPWAQRGGIRIGIGRRRPSCAVSPGPLFQGVAADVRAKAPYYASDFGDGSNGKAAAAAAFMFFSSFANAATFGTLMGAATGQEMGVLEMIVGTGVAGTAWSLAGSQPLAILCHTGPTLAFTTFLYALCQSMDLPFLPVYTATGLWIAAYMLIFAATGLTDSVRSITRYTDEVFAALCAAIFVSEVYKSIAAGFADESPDVAALQAAVALFVFAAASASSGARDSPRFGGPPSLRALVADFGAPAAVLMAAVLCATVFPDVDLPTLALPDHLGTTTGRPWLSDLTALDPHTAALCAAPAALGFVLLFLDQTITVRLVNSPDHQLRKGYGYNLDTLVLSLITAGLSLVGLPWCVAGTCPSMAHVRALATTAQDPARSVSPPSWSSASPTSAPMPSSSGLSSPFRRCARSPSQPCSASSSTSASRLPGATNSWNGCSFGPRATRKDDDPGPSGGKASTKHASLPTRPPSSSCSASSGTSRAHARASYSRFSSLHASPPGKPPAHSSP